MKVFLHNAPKTRVFTSCVSMACGGAIIGLCSGLVLTNVEFFHGFGLAFTQGGGNSQFTTAAASIVAAAVGGGIMLLSGLFGIAGHFARSNLLLLTYLILTCIGSFVAVVGGGMFLQVPSMVGERLYIDDTNSISPPLEGLEKDMNDFELAIFNECCVSRNWTEQRAAQQCTGNNAVDCPPILDPVVTEFIGNAQTLLCSCASSNTSLANFQTAIRETGFCTKARRAIINVRNLVFPRKIPGNLKLSTVAERKFPGSVNQGKMDGVPLVGFHLTAELNPDQTEVAEYPESFGCGFGYQKGIAWMTDMWFQANAVAPAGGSLALGLVNMSFIILAIAISIMQTAEEKDMHVGKVDKWEAVKDIPAGFSGTTNPMHYPIVASSSQHSGSVQNSVASSQQPKPPNSTHSSESNKANIFERLRDFYAKYDKSKNLSDVEDVAGWAAANGIEALNAKLMGKYNADLNTSLRTGSNGGMGVGAKALQSDLDI